MLQLIDKSADIDIWVEAWLALSNGNCVVKRFTVIGEMTYAQITAALDHFGKDVLDATVDSIQMSPTFAARYLYPAVIQHHKEARWN